MLNLEERVQALLRAKYARDHQWDFLGRSVVRGLMLAGCAVCRASRDLGTRELAFLLHEHVNDAETVVRLIDANGFCRRHCAWARAHVTATYEDELKIVLLYDHLARSLERRLRERPRDVGPVRPRRGCPICGVERGASVEISEWLQDALTVPEIASLYAESSVVCLRHLSVAATRDWRLESRARTILDEARQWLTEASRVPGPVAERVAFLYGGGWDGDETGGTCREGCPVCDAAFAAEDRTLRSMASSVVVDGDLCRRHVRALRRRLAGRVWPGQLVSALVERADAGLRSSDRERWQDRLCSRILPGAWRRSTARRHGPSVCPVCRDGDAATVLALSRATVSEVGERACLCHVAAVARARPSCESVLNAALRSRLELLVAGVQAACRFDQVPRTARHVEFENLADQLTELFACSDDADAD